MVLWRGNSIEWPRTPEILLFIIVGPLSDMKTLVYRADLYITSSNACPHICAWKQAKKKLALSKQACASIARPKIGCQPLEVSIDELKCCIWYRRYVNGLDVGLCQWCPSALRALASQAQRGSRIITHTSCAVSVTWPTVSSCPRGVFDFWVRCNIINTSQSPSILEFRCIFGCPFWADGAGWMRARGAEVRGGDHDWMREYVLENAVFLGTVVSIGVYSALNWSWVTIESL
jgi:hypothetical protein